MSESISTHKQPSINQGLWRIFTIGFLDGLTVPFALTAGLSLIGDKHIVIVAGVAELFAGVVSMALGTFLSEINDRIFYDVQETKKCLEFEETPDEVLMKTYEILADYKLQGDVASQIVDHLNKHKDSWVKFLMVIELNLHKPAKREPYRSAAMMASGYFLAGMLSISPYFIPTLSLKESLIISAVLTIMCLLAFGFLKAHHITELSYKRSLPHAFTTLCLGGLAVALSSGIVYFVDKLDKN